METMREHEAEVLARRPPAPAMAEARERESMVVAGAPARRKFRGVKYMPSGRYAAGISEPGSKKRTWLGTYTDEEVAACAYDLAATSLRGPKAKTNFEYPPPQYLIDAVTTAPGRRGPVYHVPPPPAAPAPGSFDQVDHFSYKAPPSEPAQNPVYPFLKDLPKTFSIQAAVAASRRVSDPVGHFAPPQNVAPTTEPVPASSVETCFSSAPTTDPQLRASASSSWLMTSNSRQLMLKTPTIFSFKFKTPKISAVPTTPGEGFSEDNFTGNNFTGINVPFYFTQTPPLPLSALMPLDVGALQAPQTSEGMGNGWPGIGTMI